MKKAKQIQQSSNAHNAVAQETGKTQDNIQLLESFNAIIAEIVDAGFQSKVRVLRVKGDQLGEALNSRKVRYSY
ncbi:hypothetical protein JW988_04650 [Candidatus Bathyarchaeota archaeon]|nr:hypothetical protein [Candidatus Bathyarchaeota archaeon]